MPRNFLIYLSLLFVWTGAPCIVVAVYYATKSIDGTGFVTLVYTLIAVIYSFVIWEYRIIRYDKIFNDLKI